jgi:hypothetical protein
MLNVLIILCGAGMIATYVQSRKNPQMRNVSLAFGGVAAVLALTKMFSGGTRDAARDEIVTKELQYAYSMMRHVGEYMAENHSGETILLISMPPEQDYTERRKVMMDGLTQGLNGKLTIGAEYQPTNPDPTDTSGKNYNYFFTAEAMDAAMEKEKESTVVLSLIGLPADFDKMSFWSQDEGERQKMVLVHPNVHPLGRAIESGFVTAIVTHKPNITYSRDAKVPGHHKEAFDQRFILVDGKNFAETSAKYPKLFKTDEATQE